MNKKIIILMILAIGLVGCGTKEAQPAQVLTCPSLSCPDIPTCPTCPTCPDCVCNQSATTTRYDSTTAIRLLNSCETRLEDCWMNSNTTTYTTNYTYDNTTLRNLYDDCIETLEEINETLN